MTTSTTVMDTDRIKLLVTHAASHGVKYLDVKESSFFVEFFDKGDGKTSSDSDERPLEIEIDGDEKDKVERNPQKEYPGRGIVSEEDAEILMNTKF